MHAVREEHHEHLRGRIDPDRRSGEPGVSKGSDRQQLAAVGREARIDVPSQGSKVPILRRRHRRRHLRDRERRQHADPPIAAAVQHHPAEDGEIGRRAEQSRMAGDTIHSPGRRIVHDAAQHLHVRAFARPAERRAALGRRDPWGQRRRRIEHRVLHPEPREHAFCVN